MKGLVRALLLGIALSSWTSAAQAFVHLQCSAPKCTYSEEIGPSQSKTYTGKCVNKNIFEYSMVCHAVKGTTCTNAVQDENEDYWTCVCTNWDPTSRKYLGVDLYCSS